MHIYFLHYRRQKLVNIWESYFLRLTIMFVYFEVLFVRLYLESTPRTPKVVET